MANQFDNNTTKPLARSFLKGAESARVLSKNVNTQFISGSFNASTGTEITIKRPTDYISRFSSTLHLSPGTQNEALKILQKAEISELTSGRGPAGIAAAALYVAALINDEKKTQREVADVAGITEVTIRNRYKELLERLDMEDKMKIKENEKKKKKKVEEKE